MTEPARVRIDQDLCTGDGLCVQLEPDVFELDIDGLAYVKDGDRLLAEPGACALVSGERSLADVIQAARECPGECIFVTGPDGQALSELHPA